MNARLLSIGAWLLFSILSVPAETNEPVLLFMPDGQLRSHLLRVSVSTDIQPGDSPKLTLQPAGPAQDRPRWLPESIAPLTQARFQSWPDTRDGITSERRGTLLLFDLHASGFTLQPSIQVTPVLKWGKPEQAAIGDRPVYLGYLPAAGLWTFAFLAIAVAVVVVFAWNVRGTDGFPEGCASRLLLNPKGRLSLSKTQAAFWTLCIGGMVLCFGLTRREVPAIPEQLVALLGLSLATRATIFITEKRDAEKSDVKANNNPKPRLRDLIDSGEKNGNPVAITKAQMLLWTGIAGILFCVKSLSNGALWEVPWQLVALMGISQASYVIPPAYGRGGNQPPKP